MDMVERNKMARRPGRVAILILVAVLPASFLLPGGFQAARGEDSVEDLLVLLGEENPFERVRAAEALGERKAKDAVDPLVKRLAADPDVLVRRAAARALGEIGDRRALQPLLHALMNQDDPGVTEASVESLRSIDRRGAVKQIVGAFKAPKTEHMQRLNLVKALRLIPERGSLGALLQACIEDDFMMVRKEAAAGAKAYPDRRKVLSFLLGKLGGGNKKAKQRAAYALGEIGDQDARKHLLKIGLNPSSKIEVEALQALAKIPHPDSVPYLLRIWQGSQKDPEIRTAAIHAMAEAGSPKILDAMKKAMESPDWFVRYLGAMGLGRLASDPAVLDFLIEGLRESRGERAYDFAVALGLSADPKAVRSLKGAARAENLKVALASVDALSRIESDTALEALADLLDDDRPEVLGLVARRIGILDHAEALGRLVELLDHASYPVRMDAAQALGRLKKAEAVEPLVALGKKSDAAGLRAVVAQALGDINSALGDTPAFHESLKFLTALLKDEDILVRAAAAWALEGAQCRASVKALILAWTEEKNTYVTHTFYQALRSITRKDIPEDPGPWLDWWEKEGDRFLRTKPTEEISIPAFQLYLKELRSKGLDLVFVLDVTGSMGPELKEAQKRTMDIIRILRRIIPSLRVGFAAFGDKIRESGALTFDYDAVLHKLNKLEAFGGGDINEAVCLGFENALRGQAWRKEARKVVVLVGDAPPHWPHKASLVAFLGKREMGVEFSAIEAHTTEVTHLPSFVEVAAQGGGQVVRLQQTRDLLRHLVVSALGPAWRAEAERVIGALMD